MMPVLTTEQAEALIAAAERGYQKFGVCKRNLFNEVGAQWSDGACCCVVGAMLHGLRKSRRYRALWKLILVNRNAYPIDCEEQSSNQAAKLVLRTIGVDPYAYVTFNGVHGHLFRHLWNAHDDSDSLDHYYAWIRSLAEVREGV